MDTKDLETKILETLSFFDEMGLDQIFLDLDPIFAQENTTLTYQDLLNTLNSLKKKKKIKLKINGKHKTWKKIYPKKTLVSRIRLRLKSFF